MKLLTCNFCLTEYDMDSKPKPVLIETPGAFIKKYICKSCVKSGTELMKPDMGPNWPRKKEDRK